MSQPIIQTRKHNQIIHFKNGYKRTIFNVVKVWENEMVHIQLENGNEWVVPKENVNCIEIQWLDDGAN